MQLETIPFVGMWGTLEDGSVHRNVGALGDELFFHGAVVDVLFWCLGRAKACGQVVGKGPTG